MVPTEYITFFSVMAAASATLFGLIFVAISIAPENITTKTAPIDRQVRATASYVALLNPLMVSLFALVPYQLLGIAALAISSVGIVNTLALSVTLLRSTEHVYSKFRSVLLIIASFVLYGFEFYVALQIDQMVVDKLWLSLLADLLIFITLFGIIRAWELIGIQQFRIRDWFVRLIELWKKNRKGPESKTTQGEKKKVDTAQ